MFKFSTDTLIRYRRERFCWRTFGPVAMVLTIAAIPAPLQFPLSFLTLMLVLFQFRLWDDLADRDYDVIHHPHRVLSQYHRASFFYGLVVAAGLTSSVLLSLLGRSIAPFLLLCVATLFWYGQVPGPTRRTILGRHVLLLKYPAFVWLIAPAHPPQLFVSMSIVYVLSAIYEVIHDPPTLGELQ
jgi:4-hydroxybenzoate polyprenyltransferase